MTSPNMACTIQPASQPGQARPVSCRSVDLERGPVQRDVTSGIFFPLILVPRCQNPKWSFSPFTVFSSFVGNKRTTVFNTRLPVQAVSVCPCLSCKEKTPPQPRLSWLQVIRLDRTRTPISTPMSRGSPPVWQHQRALHKAQPLLLQRIQPRPHESSLPFFQDLDQTSMPPIPPPDSSRLLACADCVLPGPARAWHRPPRTLSKQTHSLHKPHKDRTAEMDVGARARSPRGLIGIRKHKEPMP